MVERVGSEIGRGDHGCSVVDGEEEEEDEGGKGGGTAEGSSRTRIWCADVPGAGGRVVSGLVE